eukprot:3100984-Amphidinium_carterae.1
MTSHMREAARVLFRASASGAEANRKWAVQVHLPAIWDEATGEILDRLQGPFRDVLCGNLGFLYRVHLFFWSFFVSPAEAAD